MRVATPVGLFAAALTILFGGHPGILLARAGTVRQVTDRETTFTSPAVLDDAGTVAFATSSTNQLGSNPRHVFRIFRFDPVSGTAQQVTSFTDGVAPYPFPRTLYDDILPVLSVSDDGQWLAFAAPSDPLGSNHDLSPEVFVMRDDGSQLAQRTDDPAPNAGSVLGLVLAGNASRIAFVSNSDPVSLNADHLEQVFVVNRDGTGLAQLTQTTRGGIRGLSMSDDGERIIFSHDGDLTGGNPDLGIEVFAIQADGTNLRQLTSSIYESTPSTSPAISGDGSTIVFESFADLTGGNPDFYEETFIIDWEGTDLRQLTTGSNLFYPITQAPAITDDGQTVVFHSNHLQDLFNLDGNLEIWKINADGSGLTALTSTSGTDGSVVPVISGDGSRVAFYSFDEFAGGNNPDGSPELHAMNGSGGQIVQLSVGELGTYDEPDITADGTRIVFVGDSTLRGDLGEIYVIESDGTGLTQVTSIGTDWNGEPSIASDGTSIVFASYGNPTGENNDGSKELFFVNADGTGLLQLTDGSGGTWSEDAAISTDGSLVVFDSDANQTGSNGDDSREILVVAPDGSGLLQLTSGARWTTSRFPRIDGSGGWIVFESDADLDGGNADGSWEVWRVRSDGSGLERLTGDPTLDSRRPDISGDGERIVYSSSADPLGTNGDGNSEIFLYEPATASLAQVTTTTGGTSVDPRISGNGQYAYFLTIGVFETAPDGTVHHARADLVAGTYERVGGLARGEPSRAVPDATGTRAVFSGRGDFVEENPDVLEEIWIIDFTSDATIRVGGAAPTPVSWDHEAGPVRYDVIRGSLADVQPGSGTTDLGPVVCLEDDSPDADTLGHEDLDDPAPGEAFFYLYRGSQGLAVGPGSYGTATDGSERTAAAGDCSP